MARQNQESPQIENETKQDYIKFLTFLGLGTKRSLDKAFQLHYETTKEVSALWRNLAVKNRWLERASDHDKSK